MIDFLPWWITAISLAVITLGFYVTSRHILGVSGSWTRVLLWKNDELLDEAAAPFVRQPKLFEDALMVATIQQFGEAEVTQFLQSRSTSKVSTNTQEPPQTIIIKRVPWTAHLVFLLCLIIGGFIGASLKGGFSLQMDLGSVHQSLFGTGFATFMTLFIGGILVGFGTQLGGGCTSGHGLSGVSRLVPASIIATLSFFGAAIVFSMAMHYLA